MNPEKMEVGSAPIFKLGKYLNKYTIFKGNDTLALFTKVHQRGLSIEGEWWVIVTLCRTEKEMSSSKGVTWLVPEEEKWKFVAEQVFLPLGRSG